MTALGVWWILLTITPDSSVKVMAGIVSLGFILLVIQEAIAIAVKARGQAKGPVPRNGRGAQRVVSEGNPPEGKSP